MSDSGLLVDDVSGVTFEYAGNVDEFTQFYYEIFHFKFYDAFGVCARALRSHTTPVVVDVGANVGLFSLKCHHDAANNVQIFAFEPGMKIPFWYNNLKKI